MPRDVAVAGRSVSPPPGLPGRPASRSRPRRSMNGRQPGQAAAWLT